LSLSFRSTAPPRRESLLVPLEFDPLIPPHKVAPHPIPFPPHFFSSPRFGYTFFFCPAGFSLSRMTGAILSPLIAVNRALPPRPDALPLFVVLRFGFLHAGWAFPDDCNTSPSPPFPLSFSPLVPPLCRVLDSARFLPPERFCLGGFFFFSSPTCTFPLLVGELVLAFRKTVDVALVGRHPLVPPRPQNFFSFMVNPLLVGELFMRIDLLLSLLTVADSALAFINPQGFNFFLQLSFLSMRLLTPFLLRGSLMNSVLSPFLPFASFSPQPQLQKIVK